MPKRCTARKEEGTSDQTKLHTGTVSAGLAELRTDRAGPDVAKSATGSEKAESRQLRPKTRMAKPACTASRKEGTGPKCEHCRANAAGLGRARLWSADENSRLDMSQASGDNSIREAEEADARRPTHAKLCNDSGLLSFAKPRAGIAKPARHEERDGKLGPELASLTTGRLKMDPALDRPKAGTGTSGRQSDCINVVEPGFKESGTGETVPVQAGVLDNRERPNVLRSGTESKKTDPSLLQPVTGAVLPS